MHDHVPPLALNDPFVLVVTQIVRLEHSKDMCNRLDADETLNDLFQSIIRQCSVRGTDRSFNL